MSWSTPVINRSQADIDTAQQFVKRILENGWSSLSASEQQVFLGDLIGTLNATCLNRVEDNTEYVAQLMSTLGFKVDPAVYKNNWTYVDLPTNTDFSRLLRNITSLSRTEYPVITMCPENLISPTIDQINAIEKLLLELKVICDEIPKSFKYCATFSCGQQLILP